MKHILLKSISKIRILLQVQGAVDEKVEHTCKYTGIMKKTAAQPLVLKYFLRLIILIFLFSYSPSLAADVDGDTKKEIWHLFEYLEKSNCDFNRNGSWYKTHEAVQHIKKKYRYLTKRGLINSTEQFIDRAASRSSISGKPYTVKCDRAEPIETAVWFTEELKRYRKVSQ